MNTHLDSGGKILRGNLTYLPVVPGRLEFTLHVRRFLLESRPAVVAVELPSALERHYRIALERLPRMSVLFCSEDTRSGDEEQAAYIPIEPGDPFIEALRTASELNATLVFLQSASRDAAQSQSPYPPSYAAEVIGIDRYVEAYRLHPPSRTPELTDMASAMAWKLQGADPLAATCVVVSLRMLDPLLDAMESPQEEPAAVRSPMLDSAELFNLHPNCLAEVTNELPYYQELYETLRLRNVPAGHIDRPRWQLDLLRVAEGEYSVKTGDKIKSWQRLTFARFARNLAILDRDLIPGAYDLAVAARSVVDDNFAHEVWEVAGRFSEQQTEDDLLETVNISGEHVWVNTRRLRIRRRLPSLKRRLKPAGLQTRKREKVKGEWAQKTHTDSICSYPPEDLAIENYGRFLKSYVKSALSEESARVEPFSSSIRDGVDIRETVRKWYERKLYVRELGRYSGDVGSLVIIFDEDQENRYRYQTTWLGEHQNESDMAFYSTEPFEHLVGPGVGRAEYGGLLMTLPPRRLYDVWSDFDYDHAETKAERLLLAALDYSAERNVVYIAAKPPRSLFRRLAARADRKLIYVPLGQLSPTKLKKIRVVHVLDSQKRREEAKQYIW